MLRDANWTKPGPLTQCGALQSVWTTPASCIREQSHNPIRPGVCLHAHPEPQGEGF